MPEIVEAQTLLAALAETDEVKPGETQRQRRLHLQTAYGQAMMWAKGFAAEETKAAFARVAELAGPTESAPERFVAYDARCLRSFTRGEYAEARELAETFLREAETELRATEAGAARRMLGLILLHQGELKAARSILERALADYVPERDRETQFRFGADTEVSAASYLALAEWHLGEVIASRQSIDRAVQRAEELDHAAARAHALFLKANLECRRGDPTATRLTTDALLKLTEESGIKTFADLGQVFANWALGRIVDPAAGASGLSQALAAQLAQGNRAGAPWFCGLLAELESTTLGPEHALNRIFQGLAIAEKNGEPTRVPYLHRLRGDILLKCDAADQPAAEDAYQTAIAIAQQQGARSYELLAALALAKLYHSTGRPVEAHAVLAPALDGFPALRPIAGDGGERSRPDDGLSASGQSAKALTPYPSRDPRIEPEEEPVAAYTEMPELREAEALLAALCDSDEVKAAETQRQLRLH
jgi:tetratricopeptide (TPR) repeat protein